MSKLTIRIASAVIFLLLMIAGIFVQFLFPFVFGFILAVMVYEYHKLTLGDAFPLERILVTASSVLLFVLLFLTRKSILEPRYVSLAFVPVLISFLSLLRSSVTDSTLDSPRNGKMEDIFFPLIYIAVPFSCSVFLEYAQHQFTPLLLMSIFVVIWANDIGAYIFGMGFGQRPDSKKFAPILSPKKSWWGFWGGCIVSTAVAILIGLFLLKDIPVIHTIAVGLLAGVFSIFGDLFESLIKRRAGVKDSGTIMPGHGGLLDRFDAVLLVMPLITIYLIIAGIV